MKKILVFGASSSKKSINKQFAEFAAKESTFEYHLIDLNDFEMPLYSADIEMTSGIPEKARKFKDLINNSKGIIISLAEHNGSYTAAFKNLLDWSSRVEKGLWSNKPMLLMATSPGRRGGKNVLDHALGYFPHMGAKIIAHYSLPSFNENFDGKKIKHQEILDAFNMELDKFIKII